MILLREIQKKDLDALERFAQIPGFINLPNDRELLRDKIARSEESFQGRNEDPSDAKFLFVAEDLEQGRVVGTSMIAAQHGTVESPHFYFEVGNEKKISESINTGFLHGTLKLKTETDGPSEIGGLVLDPEIRNSDQRIGRQISFVRFLFLALNRRRFKNRILAELLPPLNKRGQSPLWEAIGRRFTNMDYWEADQLAQKNKEFILSLFPTEKIYTTFLPAEARNAIGRVGKDTEPVMHMLKKIGFEYRNEVDPFDGGPHLWAEVDSLIPIKHALTAKLESSASSAGDGMSGLLCAVQQPKGVFRAMAVEARRSPGGIAIAPDLEEGVLSTLGIKHGDSVIFMPYYREGA